MSEKNIPAFGIKRVKEFSFLINESLFELNKQVRIQFQHFTKFGIDDNLIDLTIRVFYSYDTKIPPDNLLVDFHVQNIFQVQDLKQYKENDLDKYLLPLNLIASMVGVAISHTRSLMAHNVSGTLYQENIIPIVDPVEVAKAFYPEMFIKTEKAFKKIPELSDREEKIAVKIKKKEKRLN